jgi:hypothetical protein
MTRFVAMPIIFAAIVFMWIDKAAAQAEADVQSAPSHVALAVTPEDQAAAASLVSARYHLMLAQTPAAKLANQNIPALKLPKNASSEIINSLPSPPPPAFYPDEVLNFNLVFTGTSGPTIVTAKSHPIYLGVTNVSGDAGCGTSSGVCWGNPNLFLTDFGLSTFSHLLDQYVGSSANNRYTLGMIFFASTTVFPGTSGVPTLSENDILAFVHAAAKIGGSGLGHIYHFFIPKGVDTCFDEGGCYSPDHPATFVFCAYHFHAVFSDIGSVFYSVEPFQNVPGCQVPASHPTPPNGQLADSTNNVLSHELSETISDPVPGTAFVSFLSLPTFGAEIGDLCQSPVLHFTESLNGHTFEIQAEYSDTYEACATSP